MARHLYTNLWPAPEILESYRKFVKPLIVELAARSSAVQGELSYTWSDHLEHYTGNKRRDIAQGYLDLLSGK